MRKSVRYLLVLFFCLAISSAITTPMLAADSTESNMITTLVNGGPVAVLAFIIWFQARADGKQNKEQWQSTCKELIAMKEADIKSREDNTRAMTQLTDTIKIITSRNPQ
jgi:predicted secreted protein